MGTSSEDVFLMVNHVRHKKNDGTLYMMAERVAWMLETKQTFSISHKYVDIKMQKISPEGRPKVQLQVVLHSGETTTFHFANPMGIHEQLKDRNDVKELLQQLLPKFKRRVDKELEEKKKILKENPSLYQLYQDLVMSGVISSEEFWANYAQQTKKTITNNVQQEVGVSAAFLADIHPQTDGSNGIKYNVTPEIIDSIFKTYPAVKRKHMENVPHKLSESEFWTKFFQSHYFHRDRLNVSSKDIFSDCVKNDETDVQVAIKEKDTDPFFDLNSFNDNTAIDIANEQPTTSSRAGQAGINQSVMRRFNHHSMMVLKSCANKTSELLDSKNSVSAHSGTANGIVNSKTVAKANQDSDHHVNKKLRVLEKIEYEDLKGNDDEKIPTMNLDRPDRYFHGPTPVSESEYIPQEEIMLTNAELMRAISVWNPDLPHVLSPSAATLGLGELLPGGALMKNVDGISLKDTIPIDVQVELKQLYTALLELLRHFWLCFPTTTPQLIEKVKKVYRSLKQFQHIKLEPFKEKVFRMHVPSHVTDHLVSLLEAAYQKFSSWQMRYS